MKLRGGSEKKGGRKKASCEVVTAVKVAVVDYTAGSPVEEGGLWTNRSPREIAEELQLGGLSIGTDTVRRILTEDLGLGLRRALKDEATSDCPFRNKQFEHIAELRRWYTARHCPVLSIDTKKKELLGDFFRPGRAYTDEVLHVLDHDFPSHGQGRLVPYGVYDVANNEGFMLLSVGPDTSELACDAIWRWWQRLGRTRYADAQGMLLLCDCGGSNGNRQHLFKEDLHRLVERLDIPIRVAHYPPGCSKYNPIEHRMFCHVTRALQGAVLKTVAVAREFISRTSTATGLHVVVETTRKIYRKARQVTGAFMDSMPLNFDPVLPMLNYTAPTFPYYLH
jgi:hypothetical protein